MGASSTALTLFGWGSLGGLAMATVVFALPVLVHLALAVLLLVAVAGVVALTLPDTASRAATRSWPGLASQGILKGMISAGMEALPLLR